MNMKTTALSAALAGLSAASFAQTASLEAVNPKEFISRARASAARQTGEPSAEPVELRHHRFSYNATLYAPLLSQPALVTVEFDMEPAMDVRHVRSISNVRFTLEIKAGGNVPMSAYTLRTLGPDSPVDFFPPDRNWWSYGSAYSEESFRKDLTQFFFEIPVNIELSAAGSVLDSTIKRLDGGRAYGGQGLLKLYPYCTRDLKICHAGDITGIDYSQWGIGWVNRVYPDFRLLSDETFSMAE